MYFCISLVLFQELFSLHRYTFGGASACAVCRVPKMNCRVFPSNICGKTSLKAGSLQIEAM